LSIIQLKADIAVVDNYADSRWVMRANCCSEL